MTIEHKSFDDIKKSIDELLTQYEKDNTDANVYVNTVEKTLLGIGIELVYASTTLTPKEFLSLKKETAERLGNDESNLNKVIKIARNRKIREYKDSLPTGWASLYLLCKIEPVDFDYFIEQSGITKSSTRKQIAQQVKEFIEFKTPENEPKKVVKYKAQKITFKQISDAACTSAELELVIKKILSENGWTIVKPKTEEPKVEETFNEHENVDQTVLKEAA